MAYALLMKAMCVDNTEFEHIDIDFTQFQRYVLRAFHSAFGRERCTYNAHTILHYYEGAI